MINEEKEREVDDESILDDDLVDERNHNTEEPS